MRRTERKADVPRTRIFFSSHAFLRVGINTVCFVGVGLWQHLHVQAQTYGT